MMKMREYEVYRTRVDAWLVGAVVLLLGGIGVKTGLSFLQGQVPWAILGVAGVVLLVLWALTLPCKYTLANTCLIVNSGFIRWHIPYQEIDTVELSQSVWTGPALSLQRIKIRYKQGKQILISPVHREQFMAKLNERIRSIKMFPERQEAKWVSYPK